MNLGRARLQKSGEQLELPLESAGEARELRARGASRDVAAQVAANTRRWWVNSAIALHIALTNRYFDELGRPRLAT